MDEVDDLIDLIKKNDQAKMFLLNETVKKLSKIEMYLRIMCDEHQKDKGIKKVMIDDG